MNCPHCQVELSERARFCSMCGKPVPAPATAREPSANKAGYIFILLVFVAIAAVFGSAFLVVRNPLDQPISYLAVRQNVGLTKTICGKVIEQDGNELYLGASILDRENASRLALEGRAVVVKPVAQDYLFKDICVSGLIEFSGLEYRITPSNRWSISRQ